MKFDLLIPLSIHSNLFAKKFDCAGDEFEYLNQKAKDVEKEREQVYVLESEGVYYGCIFLRLDSLEINGGRRDSCLLISYVFTSKKFRGIRFPELGDKKVSQYLIDFAIQKAIEINRIVPVRWVALEPVDEKLRKFYEEMEFVGAARAKYMYFKIS